MAKAVILLALLSLLTAAIPPQTARMEVEQYATSLQLDVMKAKRNADRFRSLSRALDEIRTVRENSVIVNQRDEGYLDLLVSALEAIPSEGEFKRKDCARYENDFLNQFEPMAEEAPMEPAVQPGWTVLQSLCR